MAWNRTAAVIRLKQRCCVYIHNDLVRAVDNKEVTALVLLDLSSAFDTVDHSTLLTVLHRRFGVEESAMDWFTSYLSDRTQTFRLNDEMSSSIPLTCSVPQGSVLGPIVFISYTHDVPLVFHSRDIKLTIISMPMTSKLMSAYP